MEIPAHPWIPTTTRNRWAWGFAWASLGVFLIWNLMPYYLFEYDPVSEREIWVRSGRVITEIWPDMVRDLYHTSRSTPDFEDWLGIMATLAVIFLALIQFFLAPLWRLIAVSRLLRFIPAGICLLGMIAILFFFCCGLNTLELREHFILLVLFSIALNLLLSSLALLLYHPENSPTYES